MAKVNEVKMLDEFLKRWQAPIKVKSKADAIDALDQMEEIGEFIAPLMARQVELKKAAQDYAVKTKTTSIDLPTRNMYFRLVQRFTRMWVTTDDDMPEPKPKNARSLKEITYGKKVKKGKKMVPLFNVITRRVADAELINEAVEKGWLTEKEIAKAFVEKPQTPFLQRYHGQDSEA